MAIVKRARKPQRKRPLPLRAGMVLYHLGYRSSRRCLKRVAEQPGMWRVVDGKGTEQWRPMPATEVRALLRGGEYTQSPTKKS